MHVERKGARTDCKRIAGVATRIRITTDELASIVGMIAAATGYLRPIGGAIAQEIIDLLAVLNAVWVALPVEDLPDF
jgi:hypothetical protein